MLFGVGIAALMAGTFAIAYRSGRGPKGPSDRQRCAFLSEQQRAILREQATDAARDIRQAEQEIDRRIKAGWSADEIATARECLARLQWCAEQIANGINDPDLNNGYERRADK